MKVNDRVEHPTWGTGTVVMISNSDWTLVNFDIAPDSWENPHKVTTNLLKKEKKD